jgi:hypothetical protein
MWTEAADRDTEKENVNPSQPTFTFDFAHLPTLERVLCLTNSNKSQKGHETAMCAYICGTKRDSLAMDDHMKLLLLYSINTIDRYFIREAVGKYTPEQQATISLFSSLLFSSLLFSVSRLCRLLTLQKQEVSNQTGEYYDIDPDDAFKIVLEMALEGPFDQSLSKSCRFHVKTQQPPFRSECMCDDDDVEEILNRTCDLESAALEAGLSEEIAAHFRTVKVDTPFTILLVRYPDNLNRSLSFYYIKNVPIENDFIVDTTHLFHDNNDGPENYPRQIEKISAVIHRCAAPPCA